MSLVRTATAVHVPGVQLPLRTSAQWIADQRGNRVNLTCVNRCGADSAAFVGGGLDKQPLPKLARLIRTQSAGHNRVHGAVETYGLRGIQRPVI